MLAPTSSDEAVVRAAAANQTAWLTRIAEAAGGVVHRERGVTWMASRAGATLAFPRVSRARLETILPRFLEAAEAAPEASCWSLLPTQPRELDDMLRAAGFREGWQAQWMALDMGAAPDVVDSSGVRVGLAPQLWETTELPWDGPGIASIRPRLTSARPRRVWHVAAWRDDVPVGHAIVNVTTGELGVAGIYDMGVAARERRRGIGSALSTAAIEIGRQAGCSVTTLNATPEGELLYQHLGFRRVGVAQTWWR